MFDSCAYQKLISSSCAGTTRRQKTSVRIVDQETFRLVLFGLSQAKWRLPCTNISPPSPEHSPFLPELCWYPTLPRRERPPARLRNTTMPARSRRRSRAIGRRIETTSGLPSILRRRRRALRGTSGGSEILGRFPLHPSRRIASRCSSG